MEHICYEEFNFENEEQDFWSINNSIWTDSEFFTALICKINNNKLDISEVTSYFKNTKYKIEEKNKLFNEEIKEIIKRDTYTEEEMTTLIQARDFKKYSSKILDYIDSLENPTSENSNTLKKLSKTIFDDINSVENLFGYKDCPLDSFDFEKGNTKNFDLEINKLKEATEIVIDRFKEDLVNNRNEYLEECNYYNLAHRVYCLEFLNRFIKTKLSNNSYVDIYQDIDFDTSLYTSLLDWNGNLN